MNIKNIAKSLIYQTGQLFHDRNIKFRMIFLGLFILNFHGNSSFVDATQKKLEDKLTIISHPNQAIQERVNLIEKKNIPVSILSRNDFVHYDYQLISNHKTNNLQHRFSITQKHSNSTIDIRNFSENNNTLTYSPSFVSKVDSNKLTLKTEPNPIKNDEHNTTLKTQKLKPISQVDSSEVIGDTLGETNRLRNELLIDPIIIKRNLKASPGSSIGTPSGYGASWGQGYIGGGLFLPFDDGRTDGSFSLGFGLGDPVKSVGLEVNVNVTSVGGGNDFDFGDSGTVGFKVHKYFKNGTAIAAGWVNPVSWGDSDNAEDTFYGVVTKSFELEPKNPKNNLPLTISLGVGSGSFRSRGAIDARENSANFFGSVGLRVTPQTSLISTWTGNRLNIGASFVPVKNTPLVINAAITDVTDNFSNGTGFSLSAGYAFSF
ncbi:MAG: hypothetical protein AAF208_07230 [Cyanobacteria bacterium P01_A01_bin.45]